MSDEIVRPYSIKVLNDVETKPGCWKYTLVGIFENDVQIGEFTYNYHSKPPFEPFLDQKTGKWFALYSKHYMWSALMSLPDCKEIWTEEGKEYKEHFCPTGFYVPEICIQQNMSKEDPLPYNPNHDPNKWAKIKKTPSKHGGTIVEYEWPKPGLIFKNKKYEEYKSAQKKFDIDYKEWYKRHEFKTQHAPFGFVAGCQWGDDTSWKIEFIDLQDVYNPKRDARFGYISLPNGSKLRDAIHADYILDDGLVDLHECFIQIAVPITYRLTGEKIKED